MMNDILVDVRNLSITIDTFRGPLRIIRNQDIMLRKGEILGVVGESGCGKSVMVNSLMGLLPEGRTKIKSEKFEIDGEDCQDYVEEDWNELRGTTVAMVFQDPMTALNPILTIGEQIYEVIHRSNAYGDDYDEKAIALDLLKKMGLSTPEKRLNQYPHELSGGMRQRVCIAMAVAGRPKILICDEPTTALDTTTEAQILRLMQGLLMSLPQGKWHGELKAIEGQPPDLYELPRGCAFNPRCKWAMRICGKRIPMISNVGNNHEYTCWLAKLEGL